MKFTLVYIIALVIFFVNGVLSGSSRKHRVKSKVPPKVTPKSKTPTPFPGFPIDDPGFCDGKTKSDGSQIAKGSCSLGIQGDIPSSDKMPSTLITFPENGGEVEADAEFVVNLVVDNLVTGHFSDPETQYNILPQQLDDSGVILGHTHVTIQKLKSDNTPPDSNAFAFFKGVNDIAGSKGELTVSVDKGLAAGAYRICAMTGAFSHQPAVMPIAKRGAQDDCIRISVK